MDTKKAKEILHRIDIKFFLSGMIEQSNYIVDKANETNTAIDVVLSELDKDNNIISDLQNEVTLKQCELDKKEKIINDMAEHIEKGCDFDNSIKTKEQIIDHFTNKYEEGKG